MMNLEELKDKSISLIVWNAEQENDVHVYTGKLYLENDECYFDGKEKGWRISLDDEQLSRLLPVSDDLKETLPNADYALSMSMCNLAKTGQEGFQETGMKWHD